MTAALRRQVRARFRFACGYCGVTEASVGAELTIDHYQPRSAQGMDDLENLIYACPACNQFKGDVWNDHGEQRILHPLHDSVGTHVVQREDGTLQALSERGQYHIETLHLNRPELIANRLAHRERAQERATIDALEQSLREAETRLDELERLLFGTSARQE